MTEQDREMFLVDIAEISMEYFIYVNNYGIQKFLLKENAQLPVPENYNLLGMNKQTSYFSDIKWALSGGSPTMSDRSV